ncbi:MAG: SMR family transporter [Magnetospirillum sp.]|nr:SMR family transporter [Magnetospirillum sp.]
MAWLILLAAGLMEIGWAVGLKQTAGFMRLLPSVLTIGAMVASLGLLGTAYAVWTGIGTIGTALCGLLLYGETMDPARLGCIGLIVTGIVGLKVL